MRKFVRKISACTVVATMLSLSGCNGNVGVGISVGVPVGNHGYVSVGTGRWR